jgi:8-oxo-dGTP diphosphatase
MSDRADLMLVCAAALVDERRRVLVQQRSPGRQMAGLWEFPGGKVEAGETPEAALVRELSEELGIVVETGDLEPVAFASQALEERHLLLLLYVCRNWLGLPRALDSVGLQWVEPAGLRALAMPPADLPLIDAIERIA